MGDLRNDIERYRNGQMSPSEMHALEKKALSDPFLADALEGAMAIEPAAFSEDVASLQKAIHGATNKSRTVFFTPLRMAAGIALIVGVGAIIFFMNPSDDPLMISKAEPPPTLSSPKPDSMEITSSSGAASEQTEQPKATEIAEGPKPTVQSKKSKDEPATTPRELADSNDPTPVVEAEESEAVAKQPAVTASEDSSPLQGQAAGITTVNSHRIKGHVVAMEDGLPLPGVNVMIKGTTQGTTTDLRGDFSLDVPDQSLLVFSFVGLETVEKSVPPQGTLRVDMKEDVSQLSEVVITRAALPRPETEEPIVKLAEPVGGFKAYNRYLEDNLRYPQQALDKQVKGRVVVEFNVGVDGKLDNFVVMRGLGYGCDDEVIRLVKEGPEWIPSTEDNKAVETSVRVRMRFDPNKGKKKK